MGTRHRKCKELSFVLVLVNLWACLAIAESGSSLLFSDPATFDPEGIRRELNNMQQRVVRYHLLPADEQERWRSQVLHPYDEQGVPLESDLADWLFGLLESDVLLDRGVYWPLAEPAFITLKYVAPTSPRLTVVAMRILQLPLPPVIDYIPHENLFASCLIVLIRSGDKEDLKFVLETEKADFWEPRPQHAKLSEPSPYVKDEPNNVVLTLRAKAAFIMAKNCPEYAIQWLPSILARPEEPEAYKTLIRLALQEAQKRIAGEKDEPQAIP